MPPLPPRPEEETSRSATPGLSVYLRATMRRLFSLRDDAEIGGTIEQITTGIRMRGSNVWMLICAAMLASLGLDTSSVAVIIGAMLVSPLMSPILGIGLSLGIHDRALLGKSLRNYSIAVLVSIGASILYFLVTPLGQLTPEMLSRTRPTLLDVGVATFGGLAGIIANTRRIQTTVVPGVAIATALMPPLCTAGYGIASGRPSVFMGAFYLFFINTVFIAASTYLIVRILRFPFAEYVDRQTTKRAERMFAVFALIVAIPSLLIFRGVISDLRKEQAARTFVNRYIEPRKQEVLRWELTPGAPALLKVYSVGPAVPAATVDSLRKLMPEAGLADTRLHLVSIRLPDAKDQYLTRNEIAGLLGAFQPPQNGVEPDTAAADTVAPPPPEAPVAQLAAEISALAPELVEMQRALAEADSAQGQVAVYLVRLQGPTRTRRQTLDRIAGFLKLRTTHDSLRVVELP